MCARAPAQPACVDAGRLRSTRDGTVDQCCDGTGARSNWHFRSDRAKRLLRALAHHLNDHEASHAAIRKTSTPGGRISRPARRRSWSPLPVAARWWRTMDMCFAQRRGVCHEGQARVGIVLRRESARGARTHRRASRRCLPSRLREKKNRLPLPLQPATRFENSRRGGESVACGRLRTHVSARTATCAAVPPAPTPSCNPSFVSTAENKVTALESGRPEGVATANIGCLAISKAGSTASPKCRSATGWSGWTSAWIKMKLKHWCGFEPKEAGSPHQCLSFSRFAWHDPGEKRCPA